jgi:hypothetical protein
LHFERGTNIANHCLSAIHFGKIFVLQATNKINSFCNAKPVL